MTRARIALVLAGLTQWSCGGASCILSTSDEQAARCRVGHKVEKRSRAKAKKRSEEEAAHQQRSRDTYLAAIDPCKRGEPSPCMTVAVYGIQRHHHPDKITANLKTACNGKIAEACMLLGEHSNDPDAELRAYEYACILDNVKGCLAVAERDSRRRVMFETRACDLRNYAACERVGLAYLDGNRVTADRAKAELYLEHACKFMQYTACKRLEALRDATD